MGNDTTFASLATGPLLSSLAVPTQDHHPRGAGAPGTTLRRNQPVRQSRRMETEAGGHRQGRQHAARQAVTSPVCQCRPRQAAETMGLPLFKTCVHWTYAKASLHVLLDLDSNGCSSQFFHIVLDESAAFVA